MRNRLTLALLLCLFPQTISAQDKPSLSEIDRIRLAEAFRIGEALGNRIWKGWDKAPFGVLLVANDNEYLIRHSQPSEDFKLIGYDSLLKSNVYYRKRTQPQNLLATFPAVGGISTIVIGQAENTSKKTSTPWVVTLLHEHFHQLQQSQPTYYADVNALNLSGQDRSGMWMLNYPFPYASPELGKHFSHLSSLLAQAIHAKGKSDFSTKLSAYLAARPALEKMLAPDDYRYFSFQLWQEGIARYTEYRMAELASRSYKPRKEFQALKDYKPFGEVADDIKNGILRELSASRLDDYQRVAFYPLGAGEGLLLDRVNPGWRKRYLSDKFFLDRYFIPSN